MPKHEYGREGAYVRSKVSRRLVSHIVLAAAIFLLALLGALVLRSPGVCVGAVFIVPPILFSAVKETVGPYAKGLGGEVAVAGRLRAAIGHEGYVVHDLKIGERGNIDHVAVMPGGIYSIETKAWSGKVFIRGNRLWVNRIERTSMLVQAFAESKAVAEYLDRVSGGWTHDAMPLLVFTGAEVGPPVKSRGVWVMELKDLPAFVVAHKGVLDPLQRSRIAAALGQVVAEPH